MKEPGGRHSLLGTSPDGDSSHVTATEKQWLCCQAQQGLGVQPRCLPAFPFLSVHKQEEHLPSFIPSTSDFHLFVKNNHRKVTGNWTEIGLTHLIGS